MFFKMNLRTSITIPEKVDKEKGEMATKIWGIFSKKKKLYRKNQQMDFMKMVFVHRNRSLVNT